MRQLRVAITGVKSGKGGIPRVLCNLIIGLHHHGYGVDILCASPEQMCVELLPTGTRCLPIPDVNDPVSLWKLIYYMRHQRPLAILSNRERGRAGILAAKFISRCNTPVAFRIGNPVSVHLNRRNTLKRFFRRSAIRWTYPKADIIIANSKGLAEDVKKVVPECSDRIRVLPNPVVSPLIYQLAKQAPDHPWLSVQGDPVIVGAGRLSRQKDFSTLIKAVTLLNQRVPCRLVIIGEGKERGRLQTLAEELGVADRVDFPGFVNNPFGYFSNASLFVLSSAWEGAPNVLMEAMALGTPVVATDCLSGPREILQRGKLGPLVPVANPEALAQAMAHTLANPPKPETLQEGVQPYQIVESSRKYLQCIGVHPNSEAH
ncbi:MAG: glycosyltransferase [Pseudomonadota bacterium]